MKATGIVRRIDNLGRVVIPKEIRRTMRIREGDPSPTTLTVFDRFYLAIHSLEKRVKDLLNKVKRNFKNFQLNLRTPTRPALKVSVYVLLGII